MDPCFWSRHNLFEALHLALPSLSQHHHSQVIQYARRLPCYLNRQFITLLSTLGVPDRVIEGHYEAMVAILDKVSSCSIQLFLEFRPFYFSSPLGNMRFSHKPSTRSHDNFFQSSEWSGAAGSD